MKTITFALLTALLAFTTAFAAEPVGTIVSIAGKATATAQDGSVRTLEIKSALFLNDKICTAAGASLQIMFLDDSVLSQGENSDMTIDAFVYNPKNSSENKCLLNMGKGFFRTVTARITALNPDRFKVKTRLATIGIRGCEVGFALSQSAENVFVLSLPEGKSITVTLAPETVSGLNLADNVSRATAIELVNAGTMVSIQENQGMAQRPISSQEAATIIEQTTVPESQNNQPGNNQPGGNNTPSDPAPDGTQPPQGNNTTPAGTTSPDGTTPAGTTPPDSTTQPIVTMPLDNTLPGGPGQEITMPPIYSDPNAPVPPTVTIPVTPNEVTNPNDDDEETSGTTGDPTTSNLGPAALALLNQFDYPSEGTTPPLDPTTTDPTTTPPPPTTPPAGGSTPPPVSTYTLMGGGIDWEWGVWAIPNQVPDNVSFIGHAILPDADVQTIRNDSTDYVLTGTGDAAAIVKHSGLAYFLQGSCVASVNIGLTSGNTWTIEVGASAGPNASLFFQMPPGVIQTSGALSPGALGSADYSLSVGGASYGGLDLGSQVITAVLLGTGTINPPTGIVGTFNFTHDGGATTVNGGFGSNLAVVPQ